MKKASTTCESCGSENPPDTVYCPTCGIHLASDEKTTHRNNGTISSKQVEDYNNWIKSTPYTISVIVFLIIIDLLTSPGIQWAYWPAIPILLFAIIAPYISFKMSRFNNGS